MRILLFALVTGLTGCATSPTTPYQPIDRAEITLSTLDGKTDSQIVRTGEVFSTRLSYDQLNDPRRSDGTVDNWPVTISIPITIGAALGQDQLISVLDYRVIRKDLVKGGAAKKASHPFVPGNLPVSAQGQIRFFPDEVVEIAVPGSLAKVTVRLLPPEPVEGGA